MERYYYKHANGSFMSLKHPLPEPLKDGISVSSKEEYENHMKQPVIDLSKQGKQREINELKHNLSMTDYQAIKFAEGAMTEEEYAPMKEQRQAWRARINELETSNRE